MILDAERFSQLVQWTDDFRNFIPKRLDNPRIMRFGQILRRFSLDEGIFLK